MRLVCLRAVQFLIVAGVLVGAAPVKAEEVRALSPGNYFQDPLQLMLDSKAVQDRTTGFTATFTKHERIKGELHEPEIMLMKCRYTPFSIYFKWQKGSKAGREAIYCEGKNENKAVGHQAPLPFNLKLVPNSPEALKESLRPITMAGFRNILGMMIKVTTEAKQAGDLKIFCTEDTYNGRPAYCILRLLPKKPAYPYGLLYVHIDKEMLVPVHIAAYDWDDSLVSRYTFTDVKLGPPLADKDFDVNSKSYGFAKDLFGDLFSAKKK